MLYPYPRHPASCILFVCLCGTAAFAADATLPAAQKVLTGLKSPCSVAVRPGNGGELGRASYEVFIAVAGAGRIVKCLSYQPGKSIDVISGFAIPPSSNGGNGRRGVQSLQFLDQIRLVVVGSDDDEQPFFRLYELPESDTPLTADQHKSDNGLPAGKKDSGTGIRTLPGIARTQPNEKFGDVLIVPSRADRGSDGLVLIPVRAGLLAEPVPVQLTSPNDDLEIDGIAAAKSGYIVLAGRSTTKSAKSSVLAFVNPLDRRVVMQVPIELEGIVALAYNPQSGNLYAAKLDPSNKDHAGIFRVDATDNKGAPACKLTKVANVKRPTALAFATDGALYVTTSGESPNESSGDGALLKIDGVP